MRRLASEVIRELEQRLARLERQANLSNDRYASDPFLAELEAELEADFMSEDLEADFMGSHMGSDFLAEEMMAGRPWDGAGGNQLDYNSPPAPKNQPDCYSETNLEGLGKPGDGETCYRLHNEYGKANSGKPGTPERAEYNRKYREKWMDSKTIKRKICPKPDGTSGPCNRG